MLKLFNYLLAALFDLLVSFSFSLEKLFDLESPSLEIFSYSLNP